MIFLWGGGGGGAAILRKLRRFLNQLSNHPCLNFLEMILLINVIVKVTPPPMPLETASANKKLLATNQNY